MGYTHRMLERVASFIEEHALLARGEMVLAGVSGGADSMALLDVLSGLRERFGFDLACATVDHGLREGTEREARIVEREARSRGVGWTLLVGDARQVARERGGGLEQAARELRFDLLEGEAAACGASRIALGHTLDDQAETVLMRLARGTGLHGLGGMHPIRDGRYARPLLCVTRREVLCHLEAHGIAWAEDPTNTDPRFARNRIRSQVIPALEACEPGVAARIAHLADQAREASRAVDSVVDDLVAAMASMRGGSWVVDRIALQRLDPVLRSFLVRELLVRLKGDGRGLGRRHFSAILGICRSGHGTKMLNLPHGIRAVRAYDELILAAGEMGSQEEEDPVAVAGPGTYRRGSIEIGVSASGGTAALPFPLELRGRRPGDRLSGRSRSLKRLLIDRKVPRPLRTSFPLLAEGRDVIWAGGLYLARDAGIGVSMRAVAPSAYLEWFGKRER